MYTNSQRTVLPPFHRSGRGSLVRETLVQGHTGAAGRAGPRTCLMDPFFKPLKSQPEAALDSPPLPQPLPASGRARGRILDRSPGPPQDIPPEPLRFAWLPHQSSRSQTDSTTEERSPEPAPLPRLRPKSPPLAGPRSAGPTALALPPPRLGGRATSSSRPAWGWVGRAGGVASTPASN